MTPGSLDAWTKSGPGSKASTFTLQTPMSCPLIPFDCSWGWERAGATGSGHESLVPPSGPDLETVCILNSLPCPMRAPSRGRGRTLPRTPTTCASRGPGRERVDVRTPGRRRDQGAGASLDQGAKGIEVRDCGQADKLLRHRGDGLRVSEPRGHLRSTQRWDNGYISSGHKEALWGALRPCLVPIARHRKTALAYKQHLSTRLHRGT